MLPNLIKFIPNQKYQDDNIFNNLYYKTEA